MSEIKVDCTGETCPIPLVETRKALRKAKEGDIVEVIGTHPSSKRDTNGRQSSGAGTYGHSGERRSLENKDTQVEGGSNYG